MSQTNNPLVFDRARLKQRRQRAVRSYQSVDFLKKRVALDIADRVSVTNRHFERAVELGAGGYSMRKEMAHDTDLLVTTDSLMCFAKQSGSPGICADEEWLPFKQGSLDLIVSGLSLNWVNDLPGSLIQIRKALKPDGFFVGAMLGGNTLTELRQVLLQAETEVTGGAEMRVSPFADALDISQLLQRAGFTLPVSDREAVTLRYQNMFALLTEIKAGGETHSPHIKGRKPLSMRILMRAAEIYAERFSDPDGKIRVSVDIIWMTGWAPHPDQPKAKKPGSANVRLADALGVKEHKL